MAVYSSIYDGPPRGYTRTRTRKKYIVIHNTSNDASAENEASYAKRRTDGVSSHYYVDSNSIVQSLDTDYKAWHVGSSSGNTYGISYEITGTNAKSNSWWKSNVAWGLLATQIKRDCAKHGIIPRTLSISEIRAGSKTGIITHNQARLAWGGTSHTDPGENFPMSYLVSLVGGATTPSLPSTSRVAAPTLREGDSGPEVGKLQTNLNDTIDAGLAVDEDFGPKVAAAVAELQRRAGITVDEIYGPDSAGALADLLEDDMDPNDRLPFPKWAQAYFDHGPEIFVRTTLASGYAHSREAKDRVKQLQSTLASHGALLEKLIAAQSGLTADEIRAAVASGVADSLPDVAQLAAEVVAAVVEDLGDELDAAVLGPVVEGALRRVLGGLDEGE